VATWWTNPEPQDPPPKPWGWIVFVAAIWIVCYLTAIVLTICFISELIGWLRLFLPPHHPTPSP
jgi:hypothetical protein